MKTLHEALWDFNVTALKNRVKILGITAKSQRKADLIDAIKTAFNKNLQKIHLSLTPLEKLAIAEASYATDMTFNISQFTAKYGECPQLYNPHNNHSGNYLSSQNYESPKLVTCFLFYSSFHSRHYIPDDLASKLRELTPKPLSLRIKTLSEPKEETGLYTRVTEQASLQEVTTLLRLAEQGSLRITAKTAMPTAAGTKTMLASLSTGDFYPPEISYLPNKKSWQQEIGAIKLNGWTRLLHNSGYLNTGSAKSSLTPSGIKALSKPRHLIIHHLWNKWIINNKFDEFNNIDEIKGQKAKGHMTAKPPRRKAIINALTECPVNEWIDTKTFSNYMQARKFDFEISKTHYKLYIADPEYGNLGYSDYGGWNILQHRYILTLLFEYAATLGLIDIAYLHPEGALTDYQDQWGTDDLTWLSRYDGLRSFRITKLGAYCLGKSDNYTEPQQETTLRLKLSPDLSIHLLSDTIPPSEKLLLETWATPIKTGTWRLDPLLARDAIERGNSTENFLTFLQQCDSDQPVPETIQGFFKTAQSNGHALQNAGEAHLFTCRDTKTTDMILKLKSLKSICSRCGESQLVVPTEHLQKFQKIIRSLGLGFK